MLSSPKDRLIRATLWHAAGRVAAGLLGVGTAVYGFHALGAERYGLLTLVAALQVALGVVEFGLRTSGTLAAAEEAARGGARELRGVLGAATLVHLVAGAAIGIPFVLLADPLAERLAGGAAAEPALRDEAAALLRVMAPAMVLGNAASAWTSVLIGMQRTGAIATGMVLGAAAQWVGTIAGVEAGWGAPALGAGYAAGLLVRSAVEAAAAGRALPGVSLLPWHATREAMRRLAVTGRPLQAARMADAFVFHWDRVLVGQVLGAAAGGVYQLAADFVMKVREAPLLLASGVLPAASEVKDADGGAAVRNLHLRGTKYTAAAALLVLAFAAAAAPELARLLGGPGAAAAAAVLGVLFVGATANIVVGVGTQVGLVLGQAPLQARAAWITAGCSLVLVPAALLAGLGLAGAAAGTAAALCVGPLWYLGPLHAALGIRVSEMVRRAILPALLPAAGVAAAVLLLHHGPLAAALADADRTRLLAILSGEGLVLAAAYAAALTASGWLDSFDRDVLRRALGRAAR
ncbi:MAG TPA: oligosaccharide flippase family protein [Planctomycetota bacterium]|nr:oligosaccharide flippase family protein [Planctomycetota bacterium]